MWPNTRDRISPYKGRIVDFVFYTGKYGPADRVTFIEEIFNGKLHFLCNVVWRNVSVKGKFYCFEFCKWRELILIFQPISGQCSHFVPYENIIKPLFFYVFRGNEIGTLVKNRLIWWSLTCIKPLSANPTKWSDTLKQFVGNSRLFKCIWPFCGVGG